MPEVDITDYSFADLTLWSRLLGILDNLVVGMLDCQSRSLGSNPCRAERCSEISTSSGFSGKFDRDEEEV